MIKKNFVYPIKNFSLDELVELFGISDGNKSYSVINFQGGETATIKKIIKIGEKKFFVKIGEKVEAENEIYRSEYVNDNPLFLRAVKKINPHDILVLPYYKGLTLDEYVFIKDGNLDDKIKKICSILNKTAELLWLKNMSLNNDFQAEQFIDEYIGTRLSFLRENCSVLENNKEIGLEQFFNFPITYHFNEETIELPSIKDMIDQIIFLYKKYSCAYSTVVIGDCQPTNMLLGDDELKIVDLSNFQSQGDLAMDLGKFFNFFNRFYLVSLSRDHKKKFEINKIAKAELKQNRINVFYKNNTYPLLRNLIKSVEANVVADISIKTKDFNLQDRIKIFKFVTNLITLRRHAKYQYLFDLLISILVDSFYEIKKETIGI